MNRPVNFSASHDHGGWLVPSMGVLCRRSVTTAPDFEQNVQYIQHSYIVWMPSLFSGLNMQGGNVFCQSPHRLGNPGAVAIVPPASDSEGFRPFFTSLDKSPATFLMLLTSFANGVLLAVRRVSDPQGAFFVCAGLFSMGCAPNVVWRWFRRPYPATS